MQHRWHDSVSSFFILYNWGMPWRFLILIGLSIYAFANDNVWTGVFLIFLAIVLEIYFFRTSYLWWINEQKGLSWKPYSIKISVNIAELLENPDSILSEYLDNLFGKYWHMELKKREKLVNPERYLDWLSRSKIESSLLENAKDLWEPQFNFVVQGNCVFFNNKPVSNGKIYGEIFIPYDKGYDGLMFITRGLSVRAFVVNGILKVQIGRMIKQKEEWLDIIQTSLASKVLLYPMTAEEFNANDDILFEDWEKEYHKYFKGFIGWFKGGIFKYPAYYRLYGYLKMIRSIGKQKSIGKYLDFFRAEALKLEKKYNIEYEYAPCNNYASIFFDSSRDQSFTRFWWVEKL